MFGLMVRGGWTRVRERDEDADVWRVILSRSQATFEKAWEAAFRRA